MKTIREMMDIVEGPGNPDVDTPDLIMKLISTIEMKKNLVDPKLYQLIFPLMKELAIKTHGISEDQQTAAGKIEELFRK